MPESAQRRDQSSLDVLDIAGLIFENTDPGIRRILAPAPRQGIIRLELQIRRLVWQAILVAQYCAGNELALDLCLLRRSGMDFENADCTSLLDGDLVVVARLEDWSAIYRFVRTGVGWSLIIGLGRIARRPHRGQGTSTDEKKSEHS